MCLRGIGQLEQDVPTGHFNEVLAVLCKKARTEMLTKRRAVLVEVWLEMDPTITPSKGSGVRWFN